jgi:DNA repair protein RecO (recombination protein O)
MGKIRAVAKGVRRPKSKLGGHLDLLTRSALLLAQGQNLDIITQSQTIDSFLPVRSDLNLIGSAIYMAELLDQFTAEQVESYPVYILLNILLNNDLLWLCEASNPELVLRHFEIQLLSHMGYQPELYSCLGCNSRLMPHRNTFSASSGGILCPECSRNEQASHSVLSREIEQLLRWYIRYILERDIKSLEFLEHLRGKGSF